MSTKRKKVTFLVSCLLFISLFATLTVYAGGKIERTEDGRRRYRNEDGIYAAEQWVTDNGLKYYAGEDGYLTTGWKQIDEDWYYFNQSGEMHTGGRIIDEVKYYFDDESGKMLSDTTLFSGCRNNIVTYYDKDGKAAYSFDSQNGATASACSALRFDGN